MTETAPSEIARPLEGRTILLISPQPWDHIFISKHHYAEELAKRNTVFFLEPPAAEVGRKVRLRAAANARGVTVASWRMSFPRELRFHAYWLYRRLAALEARRIVRALPAVPDVVWSFDFNLFPDLSAFGAPLRIFHPVDPLSSARQVAIGRSADLIISVSRPILDAFSDAAFCGRTLLVNHGLSAPFTGLAGAPTPAPRGEVRNVGYFGNLDRPFLNVALIAELARRHPGIGFHLWGPYQSGGSVEAQLGGLSNIILHGPRDKARLAQEIAIADCFILPYTKDDVVYDASNSHKILEYLSTGRPVVSRRINAYDGREDLIYAIDGEDPADFLNGFDAMLADFHRQSAVPLSEGRKAFALQFSYPANLGLIEDALAAGLPTRPGGGELTADRFRPGLQRANG